LKTSSFDFLLSTMFFRRPAMEAWLAPVANDGFRRGEAEIRCLTADFLDKEPKHGLGSTSVQRASFSSPLLQVEITCLINRLKRLWVKPIDVAETAWVTQEIEVIVLFEHGFHINRAGERFELTTEDV
jgi:hypothetical protein